MKKYNAITKKVLILGGGPAGLTCAYNLSKKIPTILLEKQKSIGGLSKTLTFKEDKHVFMTDIGPHRFFSKNSKVNYLIKKKLNLELITIQRKTQQYIGNIQFDYPLNPIQILKNTNFKNLVQFGIDYLYSIFSYRILKKKIYTFEDYIIANFGKSLANYNILNYTEKVWGISCKKIHPNWASERIKGLNLTKAVLNSFNKKTNTTSLIKQYTYPKLGNGQIYKKMYELINHKTVKINLESYPTKIIHKNSTIQKVLYKSKNKIYKISPYYLVSCIPITLLINLLEPVAPKKILEATNQLKWRSQVQLFITLNKNKITDNQWIYFPDKKIPFARISEMKNFSPFMAPKDKTSILVEFFTSHNSKIWNMKKEDLLKLSLPHFENYKLFSKKDIRNVYSWKIKYAYPLYDLKYLNNIKIITSYLQKFKNLILIGRPGLFKYTNQDKSIEMGLAASQIVLNSCKNDSTPQ